MEHSAQGKQLFTRREIEVLDLALTGLRAKEIAVKLGVAQWTVQAHIRNVYAACGYNAVVSAVGILYGLLPPREENIRPRPKTEVFKA